VNLPKLIYSCPFCERELNKNAHESGIFFFSCPDYGVNYKPEAKCSSGFMQIARPQYALDYMSYVLFYIDKIRVEISFTPDNYLRLDQKLFENAAFVPDFSKLEKLIEKIEIYSNNS